MLEALERKKIYTKFLSENMNRGSENHRVANLPSSEGN
jgi:hypothetical protein